MLPDPLHPAIVHLPIALAILLPLLTLCCALAIQMGVLPVRTWAGVVLLSLILVLSSWMALETGEQEEERVERVVAERVIEEHEEAAQTFMVFGALLFFISIVGLTAGKSGQVARGASVLVAFAVLASGIQVGHRGGALVYEHGAAQAYLNGGAAGAQAPMGQGGWGDHDDDDDD